MYDDLTMGLTVVSTHVSLARHTYALIAVLSDHSRYYLGGWYQDEPQLSLSNVSTTGKLLDEAIHNCSQVARRYHGLSYEAYQPMSSPVEIKAQPVCDWSGYEPADDDMFPF